MKIRRIMRWDPTQRKLRMLRIVWRRDTRGLPDHAPYSFALTIGVRPALLSYRRESDQIRATFLGLFINYHWSAGGAFV